MRKLYTPFSNGTEAMRWQFKNCDKCKRKPCSARIAIEKGFITGGITLTMVSFIGYIKINGDYANLKDKCINYTDTPIHLPKRIFKDKNQLELF